jgi:hypothetical protein
VDRAADARAGSSAGAPRAKATGGAPGFGVGAIGHRPNRLSAADQGCFAALTGELLDGVRAAALRAAPAQPPPLLQLLSCLAEGSDRIAVRAALVRGFRLRVELPFAAAQYERDFAGEDSRAEFRELLAQADSVREFAGDRRDPTRAYEAAGQRVVSGCQLLIALWDGLPARGRGGTAEIVQWALQAGVPVLRCAPGASEAHLLAPAQPGKWPHACAQPLPPASHALAPYLEALIGARI